MSEEQHVRARTELQREYKTYLLLAGVGWTVFAALNISLAIYFLIVGFPTGPKNSDALEMEQLQYKLLAVLATVASVWLVCGIGTFFKAIPFAIAGSIIGAIYPFICGCVICFVVMERGVSSVNIAAIAGFVGAFPMLALSYSGLAALKAACKLELAGTRGLSDFFRKYPIHFSVL